METRTAGRLTVEGPLDGERNMAADEEALRAACAGRSQARIYQWDGAWVSLGRFQRAETALRLDECERLGVRWVVRPTGGRAVLHGSDVTLSIACPLREVGAAPGSVRRAYRALAPVIAEALREAGCDAVLGEETRFGGGPSRGVDCFRHVSANDIVDAATGEKLAGTALRLLRDAVLLQASIPVGPYPVPPSAIYHEAPALPRAVFPDALGVIAGLRSALTRRGWVV